MSLHMMLISGLLPKFVEKSRCFFFFKGIRELSFKHLGDLGVFMILFLKDYTWSYLLHFDIFLLH